MTLPVQRRSSKPEPRGASEVLRRIGEAVLAARGLDLRHYKANFVRRRLAVRQRALSLPELDAYLDHLENKPDEMEQLVQTLTVNVSEFFRNPEVFRLLEHQVLPDLLERCRAGRRPLRFWSAGCAGGEEAYSVAILLARQHAPAPSVELLGTDVDRDAVAGARTAQFDANRTREVNPATRRRYFEALPGGRAFRLRTEKLAPVRFESADLMTTSLVRNIDLLLCRNLLIYVEQKLQEKLLASLARALRPGGVLVLGRVERLLGEARELFEPIDARERVYRKRSSGAAHAT